MGLTDGGKCTTCSRPIHDYVRDVGYDGPKDPGGGFTPFDDWVVLCKPCSNDPEKNPLLKSNA